MIKFKLEHTSAEQKAPGDKEMHVLMYVIVHPQEAKECFTLFIWINSFIQSKAHTDSPFFLSYRVYLWQAWMAPLKVRILK